MHRKRQMQDGHEVSVMTIDEKRLVFRRIYPLSSGFLTAFVSLHALRTDCSHRLGFEANFVGRFE